MQLVDSHCHLDCLDLSQHNHDLDVVIQRALDANICHMLCVCIELTRFSQMHQIACQYPFISSSVGLHPTEICTAEPTVETLVDMAQQPSVVAIGETGLDYYRESIPTQTQQQRFRTHIQAALLANRPLIVHTRSARQDTINILKEEGADRIGGVLHCFTEDWNMAKAACDLGFYISFSGIITFKNAKEIQSVAQKLPIERILIETDAPYLAPVPYRGKTNEPAYVQFVAQKIAELRSMDIAEVAHHTTQNFFSLFKQAQKNQP